MCQMCFESCTYFITLVEQNLCSFIFFMFLVSMECFHSVCATQMTKAVVVMLVSLTKEVN